MSFSRFSIGDIIEKASVTRVDQNKGLLLQLSDDLSGYVHVSIGVRSDFISLFLAFSDRKI